MKKMMAGSIAAMAVGEGMMEYSLNNKKTKKNATKLVNNAINMANNKLNSMK